MERLTLLRNLSTPTKNKKSTPNKSFKAVAAVFILISLMATLLFCPPVNAATPDVIISADGSVTGTNGLNRVGDTYTFIVDITGRIIIEKDNVIIDGAGHKLNSAGDGKGGIHLDQRNNITVKNLLITDCAIAIDSKFSNCLFENIEIGYCMVGVDMYGCYNNTFRQNTFNAAVSFANGSEGNSFTHNNFMINSGIRIRYSSVVGVNYFDYNYYQQWDVPVPPVVTPMYNGTDANGDGIGDTPKVVYGDVVDAHPLMNKVSTAGLPSPSPSPAVTPTPTLTPAPLTASLAESASALNFGETINFTVTVQGGQAPYTYEWFIDNQPINTISSPYYAPTRQPSAATTSTSKSTTQTTTQPQRSHQSLTCYQTQTAAQAHLRHLHRRFQNFQH